MQKVLLKNRWIVLVAAILMQSCCNFPNIWGVFQPYVSSTYGYTADAATLVMPLCVVAFGAFSILGGRVQDKKSPRMAVSIGVVMISASFFIASIVPSGKSPFLFYMGFSLFFGGGCGFINGGIFTCLMKWFADKKGFAGGMMGAVAVAFSIMLTYISEAVLSAVGTRATFVYYGIICFVVTAACIVVFVNPPDEYVEEKQRTAGTVKKGKATVKGKQIDFTTAEMLRTKQYYLLILCLIFAMPAIMLINPALVSICMERGLSKAISLNALAIASAASAAGRLICPWISDFVGRKRTILVLLVMVIAGSVWFMVAEGMMIIVSYAMICFVHNGASTMYAPFSNDLFGFKYAGTNTGFVNIANSAGALLGPVLLTSLAPLLGSNARSYIGICGVGIAIVCMVLLNPDMKKVRQKMDEKQAETENMVTLDI